MSKDQRPAARLVPLGAPLRQRVFGSLARQIVVGPEFFEPLPESELASWARWWLPSEGEHPGA